MTQDSNNITINLSTGTVVKIILLLLLFASFYFFKDLILVVLTAVVIASAIEPATKWFVRFKIPRAIAVLLVYTGVAAVFVGIFYAFIPVLLNESSNFLASLPQYVGALDISGNLVDSTQSVVGQIPIQEVVKELQMAVTNMSGSILSTISFVFGGAMSFLLILIFSFYFAAQERGIDDFLSVVTPLKHQKYILDLWKRSQIKIGRWMQGQLILGVIIGVLVYLGLTVLGVKYALLLAVLAALFELIPLFGPILAAIPAIGIALSTGGLTLALFVIGLYLIIQQFENHLIYPLVVTKVVGVPPLLVILALIVGAQLAGFLGVILAVPAATVVQELVKDIQKNRAEFLKKGVAQSS